MEKIRQGERREKMQVREKVGKSPNTVFFIVFPVFCGSGGSRSRLAKVAGAETSGQRKDKKCTPLWREARLEVKSAKTHCSQSTFGS